jgi:hypothetical protein
MSTDADCERIRAIAAELALGIADGRERADALAHIGSCAACRAHLAELTEVADDLLTLAPAETPPVGFETRVLSELGIEPGKRFRWIPRLGLRVRRLALGVAGASVLAAGAAAAGVVIALDDERDLAAQYESALESVGGEYFQATRLHDAAGTEVGQVFGYQGEPSWLFVVVYDDFRETPLRGTLTTTDGDAVPLRALELDEEQATWGGSIPVDLRDVETVRLTAGDGNEYSAEIPPGPE